MAREVLSNGVINPDKYQADWYADLSNNWNLLNNLIGSAISGSEVDSKIATAIQELMVRTFQIVAELPETGTEGVMYLVIIPDTSKYTAYVWENSAYRELGVIQMTITIDDELSTTSENPAQNKVITNALNGKANISHTHSASDITSGLATVATSGSYNDLSNTPTIPTVNDATLTIQKNGTTVDTFTANSSADKTVNISVPTKTSDLTNDSGFITSDTTKIPLAGTNALSGNIVPSTDNSYDFGNSSHNFKIVYAKEIRHGLSSGSLVCSGGNGTTNGANLVLYGTSRSDGFQGRFDLVAKGSSDYKLTGLPSGTLTWGSKNVAMQEDVVPRSGGAVMTGSVLGRTVDNNYLNLRGSNIQYNGAAIWLYGKDAFSYPGQFWVGASDGTSSSTKWFVGTVDGSLSWNGQPIQYVSDQRYKQQIAQIDDKLLDAWEDVEPCQFKYNDAVKEKSDNARLHTGYVVQQIDEACKSHGVDISQYGLYCHEVYPEEAEEVEVEQEDGTKTKEKKVIREASEHYSLRYTEALIVECKYLRRCIERLTARIEELEKGNKEEVK